MEYTGVKEGFSTTITNDPTKERFTIVQTRPGFRDEFSISHQQAVALVDVLKFSIEKYVIHDMSGCLLDKS